MIKSKRFKRWLIAGGLFNIMVSVWYIFPQSAQLNLTLLSWIHEIFQMHGTVPNQVIPTGLGMLYLNGFGIVDVTLGVLLLYNAKDIANRSGIAFFDAIARVLFAFLMVYGVIVEQVTFVALVFVVIEMLFALVYMKCIFGLKLKVW